MLIGYAHFIILASTLWHYVQLNSQVLSLPPTQPPQLSGNEDTQSLRRFPGEYDTDSILFYNLPPSSNVGNNTSYAGGTYGATSGEETNDQRVGGGMATVDVDNTDSIVINNKHLKNVTEDDIMLSNSI